LAKGVTPMADDEQSTSGMVSSLAQVFVSQLRTVTEGLENLAGFGERLPSDRGPLLLPGALSAAQVTSIADSVAAQRRSIEALKAQLSAFDEQLAVLEQILGPFAEWSRSWADLEKQLVNMRRSPEAEGSLSPLPFVRVGLIRCRAALRPAYRGGWPVTWSSRIVYTVAAGPGYRGPLPRASTAGDTATSKAGGAEL
jgi:hypothetical protein